MPVDIESTAQNFDPYCINVWSGPRCISTSLMYAFAQRDDTKVVDEPLYAHYLRITGAERPYRDQVLASQENDGNKVVSDLLLGPRDKKVLYAKHMAKQYIDLGPKILDNSKHVILIRDPVDLLPSFAKVVTPTLEETCLPSLCALYSTLRSKGRPPAVVISSELQADPEGILRSLCQYLDLEFDPKMLTWEPGARPEDGCWAPWWYENTHKSSGFDPPRESKDKAPLSPELNAILEEALPFYNILKRRSLKAVHPEAGRGGEPEPTGEPAPKKKHGGTHVYKADPRNATVLIGMRDGMTGEFSLVPRAEAKVSVFDSCFMLGDGMWEGIRVYEGCVAFMQAHLDRLFEGCKAVDMDLACSKNDLLNMIYRTLDANDMKDHVHIRLMVSRGLKPTPYQNPATTLGKPLIVITCEWKQPGEGPIVNGIRLMTCHVARAPPNTQDPAWNSHSKLNCIAACIQANKMGADEALMLDPNGFVSTCNSVNFFCVRKVGIAPNRTIEVWAPTPRYQMAGITRSNVIHVCREAGVVVREHDFYLTSVYGAEEVFVTGTFAGVIPVTEVDGRVIGNGKRGPLTEQIQGWYKALVKADVGRGRVPSEC